MAFWGAALTAGMSALDKLRASKGMGAAMPGAGFTAKRAARAFGGGGGRRHHGGLSKRDIRGFYKTIRLLKKVGMRPKGISGRGGRKR